MVDILDAELKNLKNGYTTCEEGYSCLLCGKVFENGEIFSIEEHFFEAEKAIRKHIDAEHGEMLPLLLDRGKKETGLTDVQKELVRMFYSGFTDKEIAEKCGIAAATVRYQRYNLRERAKQAKLYLAIIELMEEKMSRGEQPAIHKGAKMVDERYMFTKEEEEKICEAYVESVKPLHLISFPAKAKKKIVILRKIAEQFEEGKQYAEKEVNSILAEIYYDIETVRRSLIEYGFMERTKDGSAYWLKS